MPPAQKPILFTPGPLMTSETVKEAMMTDYGSRDRRFMDAVKFIREEVISIAELDPKEWVCILQQGAGTMGIEAAISTIFPRKGGKYLLINSGKYSEKQAAIVKRLGCSMVMLKLREGEELQMSALESILRENPDITTVGFVQHETSTGMVYPAEKIAATVHRIVPAAKIIVDGVSAFGGIPFSVAKACDILVTTPNKCLHSVPGISIILARRSVIMAAKGCSRSATLDLAMELVAFDKSGQFAITPPVHVVMALQQALIEYKREGGLAGRQKSYHAKSLLVRKAVKEMGFTLFLDETKPSYADIVVCVNMPTDPRWNFKKFYTYLNDRGLVIYPGKASHAETFRFGIIGHTSLEDCDRLMKCAKEALKSMGIDRLEQKSKL
ncbi:2-aminoethylphosphonate:pyruvateaminotransferas e-like protein [Leptomonas pyrrhocoris]|uniref:2-aminoethylphosphonate:pyruvateaminotransferas e-like protein n=1 Tax=Leptomonas pyrrhocoris TaxID=157538 RepID=A0A0M9FQ06_LEPPY|nr:2-aminoethylphosphonate:pyruvateaminotransferas e-like protein [Leptomonas pyrrhocoris]KPA73569.1 2-aminoethylphosphonate:pyruvateaminotransferas e-like protein [Leptomonas pyrrhocoris]|eukprot:XP_015652008.1 2-aminoethylphosphonate:pyruvateaminotransferas e-like protein [Leptomonas pyrrhocoris]